VTATPPGFFNVVDSPRESSFRLMLLPPRNDDSRSESTTSNRPGFTLFELMLVLALLVILAAVALPSFAGLKGNGDQRAAADLVRGRIADGRGLAMESGSPYRLAVNKDGTALRLAPEGADFATLPAADIAAGATKVLELKLDHATVNVVPDGDAPASAAEPDGWVTIGTFLADGSCREDAVVVQVQEDGFPPLGIRLRGVTGTSRVVPPAGAKP